jgi:hypothetical protein
VDFRKSSDSGATFSSAVKVGTGAGYFPRIAINNAEKAYVVYTFDENLASGNYWPRGFKSTNGAFSKILEYSDLPGSYEGADEKIRCDIAVENIGGTDNVYVVWPDAYNVANVFTIDLIASTDEGNTWATSSKVSTPGGADDDRYPALAVKGNGDQDVYAAWVRVGSDIRFNYSTNAGVAWAGETAISGTGSVQNQRPGLAASKYDSKSWVFALWCANDGGINNVYFDYANSDNYATWQTDDKRGNSSYHAYSQDQPSIAVKPFTSHLYAAWRDTRDGTPHIYFQEATWTGSAFRWGIDLDEDGTVETGSEEGIDLRVNENSSGAEDTPTVIASGNGEVYVTWRDAGAGIMCARYDTGPVGAAPGAPTNLTATAGDAKVNLDWDDNTEADFSSYNIYRSTTRGQWNFLISSGATSSYENSSLTNGTCYWYVVTAVDTEGFESNYSNDAHATPNVADTTKPAAPTALTAAAGNLEVSLSWTASTSTDVSGYQIYRSTVSGSGYSYVAAVIPVYVDDPTTSYTDTGLVAGVVYYYVVAAVDTSNNVSSDSNEANAAPLDASGQVVLPPAEFPAGPGLLRTSDDGCFIATAAYGTPLAIEVGIFSRFRDEVLLSSGMGRQFVKAYQKLSPPLAGFIARRPWLKMIVRAWLKPIVKVSRMLVEE